MVSNIRASASQPRRSFLTHCSAQVQAHTQARAKIPPHRNRPSLPQFLRPSAPRHRRPSERNVGLSDRRRSVSISSKLIHTLPSSRLTESSVPAATSGSGCVVTPAIVLSRGRPIARAVSLRKGRPSRSLSLEIILPSDPVTPVFRNRS